MTTAPGLGLGHPDIDDVGLGTMLLALAAPHSTAPHSMTARPHDRTTPRPHDPTTFVLPIAERKRRRPYNPSESASSIASSAQRAQMASPAARAS